jgi:hypothetical protein
MYQEKSGNLGGGPTLFLAKWRHRFCQSAQQGCQIFLPKILIRVYFVGPWRGKCWYIVCPFGTFGVFYGRLAFLWSFGIFYGHLVYFMDIWYILWTFGIFFYILVHCPKKNLATLAHVTVWPVAEDSRDTPHQVFFAVQKLPSSGIQSDDFRINNHYVSVVLGWSVFQSRRKYFPKMH